MISDAGREQLVSKEDVRGGVVKEEKKKRERNTPQSDTTIISIAGERGAVRER